MAGVTGSAIGVVCAFLLQRNMGVGGALWSLLAANTSSTMVIVGAYFWLWRRSGA
jgi:hypothetical protein